MRLAERLPRTAALELLLTGGPQPAERAVLVAHHAPLAVAAVERAVTERTAFRDEDTFVEQDRIVASVPASHDAREDARALTEKRAPHWQGR